MRKVFFVGNLHFGNEKIIKSKKEPFSTLEKMDEYIINQWNSVVGNDDKVFILGEFTFYNKEKTIEIIKKLNGNKNLIMGNNDRTHSYSWWIDAGINEVSKYPIIFSEWFILSNNQLYLNENIPYANIYGNSNNELSDNNISTHSFCVSGEKMDYKPIEFSEIVDKIQ